MTTPAAGAEDVALRLCHTQDVADAAIAHYLTDPIVRLRPEANANPEEPTDGQSHSLRDWRD